MPKGWKWSDSPDCNIGKTFTSTIYFPNKTIKANPIKRIYRNPIFLAKEYKKMIDSGETKNQSEFAKLKGIPRARATQILGLLKFNSLIIQELKKLGDPLKSKIITERMLRSYVNKSSKEQKILFNILKSLFLDNK